MSQCRNPIDARHVPILPWALLAAPFADVLKEAEAAVEADHQAAGGRAGSLRAARRLARRTLGLPPLGRRLERPPTPEVRRLRKALRRKLARA